MKAPRAFRPACLPLEDRVALSLSLSGLMDSLFPFLKKDDPAPKRPHGAIKAQVMPTRPQLARTQRLAAANAAHSDAGTTPDTQTTADVPVYGPFLPRARVLRLAARHAQMKH